MRWTHRVQVLAGILIALVATGSMRIAHRAIAHTDETTPCVHVCSSCAHTPAAPDQPAPEDSRESESSDCGVCTILAVLLTDGLPPIGVVFHPALPAGMAPAIDSQALAVFRPGVIPGRGPPARCA